MTAPRIDWLYDRKSCATCQKARAHCAAAGVTAAEVVDARTVRYGPAEVLTLLAGVDVVVATRGKAVVRFDLRTARPADADLLACLIGPTGNLRAPAARVSRTLVVGYAPAVYAEAVG